MRGLMLLFFILSTSAFAQYQYKGVNSKCFYELHYDSLGRLCAYQTTDDTLLCSATWTMDDFLDGYYWNASTSLCEYIGVQTVDLYFLLGLSGVLIGFTILFFSVYLSILGAKK